MTFADKTPYQPDKDPAGRSTPDMIRRERGFIAAAFAWVADKFNQTYRRLFKMEKTVEGIQNLTDPTFAFNGETQWGPGGSATFQMVLAGNLDSVDPASLPVSGIGTEMVVVGPKTITTFYAERVTEGSSGTTTIQLEVNGTPVAGGSLSWNPGDPQTTKSVTVDQVVLAGDLVSFRLTAKETGAADIIAGAA